MNGFHEVCERLCINYQCSVESAQGTFWYIINTVNKELCLDMSVRANISIPELTLGTCVLLSPKSGKNWRKNCDGVWWRVCLSWGHEGWLFWLSQGRCRRADQLEMTREAQLACFEQMADREHPLAWGSRDGMVKSRNRMFSPTELGNRTLWAVYITRTSSWKYDPTWSYFYNGNNVQRVTGHYVRPG